MSLQKLLFACAEILGDDRFIEKQAKQFLLQAKPRQDIGFGANNLPLQLDNIMRRQDALPLCDIIRQMAFCWSPPTTSASPKYIKDSQAKSHVELVGPEELAFSDRFRIGLYGMARIAPMVSAPIQPKKSISCWQVKCSERWAGVNIPRIMPGRAPITPAI